MCAAAVNVDVMLDSLTLREGGSGTNLTLSASEPVTENIVISFTTEPGEQLKLPPPPLLLPPLSLPLSPSLSLALLLAPYFISGDQIVIMPMNVTLTATSPNASVRVFAQADDMIEGMQVVMINITSVANAELMDQMVTVEDTTGECVQPSHAHTHTHAHSLSDSLSHSLTHLLVLPPPSLSSSPQRRPPVRAGGGNGRRNLHM